jgi:hypothetical protein
MFKVLRVRWCQWTAKFQLLGSGGQAHRQSRRKPVTKSLRSHTARGGFEFVQDHVFREQFRKDNRLLVFP